MFDFLKAPKNPSYETLISKYEESLAKYTALEARVTTIEMFHDKYKKQVRRRLIIDDEPEQESKDTYNGMLVPI